MRVRAVRLCKAMAGAALLVAVATAAAPAEDAWKVTRLRTEKVTLYDCKDPTKKTEFARKDFQDPWPVISGPSAGGLLQVRVGGQPYCVRAYAVETNKPVSASSECGAVVAAGQPKSAATRGMGEECKQR